jgi:hypothetical protein
VEDGLQIVPPHGLGLTPEAVYRDMCGASRGDQVLRLWAEKGSNALLSAILRALTFNVTTSVEHPSAQDIGALRTSLHRFASSSTDHLFNSFFPGAMIHATRSEFVDTLASPKKHLSADVLYVYHAMEEIDFNLCINLITVGEGSPYLTVIVKDDDPKTRCITLYENRSVKPAHYEAVCMKHAVGPSRLRTIFPLADGLMQSLQASQDSNTGNKKRKARGSTGNPKLRRRSMKAVEEDVSESMLRGTHLQPARMTMASMMASEKLEA